MAVLIGSCSAAAVLTTLCVYLVAGAVALNLQDVLAAGLASAIGAGLSAWAAIYAARRTIRPALQQVALQTFVIMQDRLKIVRGDYDFARRALSIAVAMTPNHARDTFFVNDRFNPDVAVTRVRDMATLFRDWSIHIRSSADKYSSYADEYAVRMQCSEYMKITGVELDELATATSNKVKSAGRDVGGYFLQELILISSRADKRAPAFLKLLSVARAEELLISSNLPSIFPPTNTPPERET